MKKITSITISALFGLVAIVLLGITPAAASATATISATSSNGTQTVGTAFNITISVDGGGQSFTSFSANVSTSNLDIISLTKGSNVTQWTTSPSASSLNFSGAVSGSATSVTVYTLSVKGSSAGTASITISGGSVKATDGFTITDIFSSSSSASFTISAVPTTTTTAPKVTTTPKTTTPKTTTPTPTPTPTVTTPAPAAPVTPITSTVVAKITLPGGAAAVGATVSLSNTTGTKTADNDGLVLFSNVTPGTYTLSANVTNYSGSKNVVVSTDSNVSTVSLELAKEPLSKTTLAVIGGGIGVMLLAVIIIIVVFTRRSRNSEVAPEQVTNTDSLPPTTPAA